MEPLSIVFAPGMMCDGALFEAQRAALGEVYPVRVADFSERRTISELAADLVTQTDGPFFLIGLSMGGIVAFEVWRQASDRVMGLALLNTTPFADSPARRQTRQLQVERVRRGELKSIVLDELKPNYLANHSKADQNLLDKIYGMAERLGADAFIRQSDALRDRCDSTATLGTITCPTVIISGAEDEVCPPELHEIMHAGIEGSDYHLIPKCGHLSTLEAPDQVTPILRDHIRSIIGDETSL